VNFLEKLFLGESPFPELLAILRDIFYLEQVHSVHLSAQLLQLHPDVDGLAQEEKIKANKIIIYFIVFFVLIYLYYLLH